MRADAHPLETVLGQREQWVVPVYQRHYEWESESDKQIPRFWEDLRDQAIDILNNSQRYPHYFGALLFSEPPKQQYGAVRKRYLVDGQQRITTFQLGIIALRENARKYQIERLVNVCNSYLFNEKNNSMAEPEREIYKLWPSSYDRDMYIDIAILSNDDLINKRDDCFYSTGKIIKSRAGNLLLANHYLNKSITAFIDEKKEEGINEETVLDALMTGFLSSFQIVVIQLDENDDAQEIFASLNGLGKPLSPFDLIRNDIFHRARKSGEDYEKIFENQWKEFETNFWSTQVKQGRFKRARYDHMVAHTVIAETAKDINIGKIANEYQKYAKEKSYTSVENELGVLINHGAVYKRMELRQDGDDLSHISSVFNIWDMSTFHPLIMWIENYIKQAKERKSFYSFIESYIVRREICDLTSKNYNKNATSFLRFLHNESPAFSDFHEHVLRSDSSISRIPTDSELIDAFRKLQAYGRIPQPRIKYILQQIEHALRTKFDEATVSTSDLTIEHIMPQKWAAYWPLPNGETAPFEETWQIIINDVELDSETKKQIDARQEFVNVFGNLTLLTKALNPSLSNGPWEKKRIKLGKSLLVLNRDVAEKEIWDEGSIIKRATQMGKIAVSLWPY